MRTPRTSLPLCAFCLFIIFFASVVSAQEKAKPAPHASPTSASQFPAAKKQPSAVPVDPEGGVANGAAMDSLDQDSPDQIRKRDEWFYRQRSSAHGHIPAGARLKAFAHMQRMMESEGKLVRRPDAQHAAAEAAMPFAPVAPSWTPIGPAPTTGGTFSPTTGRVTAIAVDPSDPSGNTLLLGAAQGGIWRSTDAGATWTAVGDQNPSLAMGSIAFAPSSPGVVYAGTGEQASLGFDVYYGAGVLKSSDHGQTWTQTCTVASATCPFLGPFSDFTFGFFSDGGARISYVAVNPFNANLVLVAAQISQNSGGITGLISGGVYCSDDGGSTWNSIPSATGEMATFVGFASATTAYAALGATAGSFAANPNGIYFSGNADGKGSAGLLTPKCGNITFSNVTANGVAGVSASRFGRIDLAIATADLTGKTAYASIADASIDSFTGRSRASSPNLGVFKTTDGGATWTNTNAPDVCAPQCWYDNVIKADPARPNIVFFGGGAHRAIINNSIENEWVVRSIDGGGTWSPAIPSLAPLGGDPALPHVDQHAMAFVQTPAGMRLYLGNDGGIWRTDDAEASNVAWTNLNNAPLQITQFYPSLSIHPSNPGIAFGGTQDNGSQNFTGTMTWANNNFCGDGGWTLVDPLTPSTVYLLCQVISLARSVNNGSPGSFHRATTGINLADPVNFIAPMAIDPVNPQNLYFGTTNIYQSTDGAASWQVLTSGIPFSASDGVITALAVGGGTNANVIYAGYEGGELLSAAIVAPGQANFSNLGLGQLPPREPTQIVVDSTDPTGNTIYVTYSGFASASDELGHIFKSTNAGVAWTDISCTNVGNCRQPHPGDLPNIPVNDLGIDPQTPGTLYAATDLGVFQGTCTAAACTWTTFNNNSLPNVAVLSLRLHQPSRTLRAATHGRGMWDLVLPGVAAFGITSISPTSATAGDPDLTSFSVSGNGFTSSSRVTFTINGTTTQLTTVFDTASHVTATIPASSLQAQGVAQIAVVDTQTTNSLPFPVLAHAPLLTAVSPSVTQVQANPANMPLTVTGANFNANSTVVLNPFYLGSGGKTNLSTSFNAVNGQLTATVPAGFFGAFGSTNDVAVSTTPPGGGVTPPPLATLKILGPVPVNDNFSAATDLAAIASPNIQDTSGATTEAADPIPPCGQVAVPRPAFITFGNSNSIWYKFTPPTNGNLSLSLAGSSYVAWLSVWTGASQSSLVSVPNACSGIPVPNLRIQPQLPGVAVSGGTTYYIMVGSAGPIQGGVLVPPGLFAPNPIAFGGKSVLTFSFAGTADFLMHTQGAATATVNAGSSATYALTIAAANGFASSVNVTCSLPAAGATCSANPATVAPGGSTTVTVTTTAHQLFPPSRSPRRFGPRQKALPLVLLLALALLLLVFAARTRRQRLAISIPLAGMLLFLILQAQGCGGGSSNGPPPQHGTQPGAYAVTITGTSVDTSAISHATTVSLTVN